MEIPIIQKTYEVYKGVVDINNHLDKRWRYSLGHSIEESVLALLDCLIMAKHAPKPLKVSYLLKSTSHLEISRLKLRLILEFKAVKNETNLFKLQTHNEEIGKMLGGWIRSLEK
ncbi:four helix bundle protein [Candidatus Nomurabacteria bacterium]|nr:four helix bundle protein [Candidatus Nomurabacteria bacterium]